MVSRIFIWSFVALTGWVASVYAIEGLPDYKNHPCIRPCEENVTMTCEYDFILQNYFTMTLACGDCPFVQADCFNPGCIAADGHHRGITVINLQLPGPGINVCQDDIIAVNLINHQIGSEGASIHWHGIHQRHYQHMDGLAMVTQCPVPHGSTFQYRFPAVEPGTHFYHSHIGLNRADGLFGAMVVRQPELLDPHSALYEYDLPEHTVIVADWLKELSVHRFFSHILGYASDYPGSILINGMGAKEPYLAGGGTFYTPFAEFSVQPGTTYRFRFINNGILHCPIRVSIDNHKLLMIATDGTPFSPVEVDAFVVMSGERYDFVLETNQPVDNYWIRAGGIGDCVELSSHQEAILRYDGATPNVLPAGPWDYPASIPPGEEMNPLNQNESPSLPFPVHPVDTLSSLLPSDTWLTQDPDVRLYLSFDFNELENPHSHDEFTPQIDYISNILPPNPLLFQYDDVPPEMFCNAETLGPVQAAACKDEFCECIHVIELPLCAVVELILVDEGIPFDANHPMHLHGYNFRVLGMEKLGSSTTKEAVQALDGPNGDGLPRNLIDPVAKDTVTMPDGGYTIIKFMADNPGFWFFHCHIEFHVDQGMGLFFQVGRPKTWPKKPRGFPKCGDWTYSPLKRVNRGDRCERRFIEWTKLKNANKAADTDGW